MLTSVSSESNVEAVVLGRRSGPPCPDRGVERFARPAGDEDAVVAILGEQRACGLEVEDRALALPSDLTLANVGDAGDA